MKKSFALVLLCAAAALPVAEAATNSAAPLFKFGNSGLRGTNAAAAAAAITTPTTEIISKSAYFDLKARTAIYLGAVHVKDPRLELSCETLTVKITQEGSSKYQSVIAETDVVIDFEDEKGQRVHGTGGKAIYTYHVTATYTNDVMELLENPVLQTGQGTWSGKVITLDRVNNTVKATESRMLIRQPPGITNSSIVSPK